MLSIDSKILFSSIGNSIIVFVLLCAMARDKLSYMEILVLTLISFLIFAIITHIGSLIIRNKDAEKFDNITQSTDKQQEPIQINTQTNVQSNTPTVTQTTQPTNTITIQSCSNGVCSSDTYVKSTQSNVYAGQPNQQDKEVTKNRAVDGVEIDYSKYDEYHHIPISDTYKPSNFEYGYSFLPPEKWFPTPIHPPVCVSEKKCPVSPTYTSGAPVDVKEWNDASKILPPDGINTTFVKEVLNAGR